MLVMYFTKRHKRSQLEKVVEEYRGRRVNIYIGKRIKATLLATGTLESLDKHYLYLTHGHTAECHFTFMRKYIPAACIVKIELI